MRNKILVVDDEKDVLIMVKKRLKTGGYDVITALDGQEGLKKAKEERPDLIVLDILMPNVDGVTMAANLRNDPEIKDTPIIFLTCLVEDEEVKQKHHLIGGGLFLAKPFDAKELLSMVQKVLKK